MFLHYFFAHTAVIMDAVETDFTQILKLTNALFAEDIEQVAFSPNFKSQIAALVLR